MDQTQNIPAPGRPAFGIGTIVGHPTMGRGKVIGYEGSSYVVAFRGGEVRTVSFTYLDLKAEEPAGDPELDRVRQAVRDVLGEHGWLDAQTEMVPRWTGGTLRLVPGREGVQGRDWPVEAFFAKLIGLRDRLRVLEQKINSNPRLAPEEKLELEGYITRCYGSLTSFNCLFADKAGQFRGTGSGD